VGARNPMLQIPLRLRPNRASRKLLNWPSTCQHRSFGVHGRGRDFVEEISREMNTVTDPYSAHPYTLVCKQAWSDLQGESAFIDHLFHYH
jgi:hypothetical protein